MSKIKNKKERIIMEGLLNKYNPSIKEEEKIKLIQSFHHPFNKKEAKIVKDFCQKKYKGVENIFDYDYVIKNEINSLVSPREFEKEKELIVWGDFIILNHIHESDIGNGNKDSETISFQDVVSFHNGDEIILGDGWDTRYGTLVTEIFPNGDEKNFLIPAEGYRFVRS